MNTKPVLCAVDVSDQNEDSHVLKRAAQIAELDGVQLDVMTVVPDFGMSVVAAYFEPGFHEKAVADAEKRLEEIVTKTLGAEANKKVRHVVATGKAYEEIIKAAHGDGAGLIVIGAHKPEFTDYLLGPNATKIVGHSDCSVLVVR